MPMTIRDVQYAMKEIAKGYQNFSSEFVHRDLKPENVLIHFPNPQFPINKKDLPSLA